MLKYQHFFDGYYNYDPEIRNLYPVQGSSPQLLDALISYIEKNQNRISRVDAALYLYNNAILHNKFRDLAVSGVPVNVFSIPLEGYDDRYPQYLYDIESGERTDRKYTKLDLAKQVYRRPCPDSFTLYLNDHIYVRSRHLKKFSKGEHPYSLHIKTMLFQYDGGGGAIVSTSSNFAVRDKIKMEHMDIIEGDDRFLGSSRQFFSDLQMNSPQPT